MGALAVPAPDNLFGFGNMVESDVYDICQRVKEVDPRLSIYVMPERAAKRFSIVENCADGVERLVFRTDELDARIIEKLEFLLRVPFADRFEAAEKIEAKAKEDADEKAFQELYERMGRPMLTDLERCGFIQRSTSYAKRGVAGGRPRATL